MSTAPLLKLEEESKCFTNVSEAAPQVYFGTDMSEKTQVLRKIPPVNTSVADDLFHSDRSPGK